MARYHARMVRMIHRVVLPKVRWVPLLHCLCGFSEPGWQVVDYLRWEFGRWAEMKFRWNLNVRLLHLVGRHRGAQLSVNGKVNGIHDVVLQISQQPSR